MKPEVIDDSAPSEFPWDSGDGFQLGGVRSIAIPIVIDGENADAAITYAKAGARVAVDGADPATDAKVFAVGHDAYVVRGGRQTRIQIRDFAAPGASASAGDGVIKAPMHGKVLEVLAAVGDRVAIGQRLAVIEAMKMEHTLRAPFAAHRDAGSCAYRGPSCGKRAGHGARADPGKPGRHKVGLCRFISSSFASVANSVRDLEDWIKQKLKAKRTTGEKPEHIHRTRMVPKRAAELTDGGSLYWVIRGEVMCRQRLRDVRPFRDKDGIGRCGLVLDPKVILVEPRPYRAFQGWRYLAANDAPRDLDKAVKGAAAMPETLRRELRELGLM